MFCPAYVEPSRVTTRASAPHDFGQTGRCNKCGIAADHAVPECDEALTPRLPLPLPSMATVRKQLVSPEDPEMMRLVGDLRNGPEDFQLLYATLFLNHLATRYGMDIRIEHGQPAGHWYVEIVDHNSNGGGLSLRRAALVAWDAYAQRLNAQEEAHLP